MRIMVFRSVESIQTIGFLKMRAPQFFEHVLKVLVITIKQKYIEKTACLSFLKKRRFESVQPIGTLNDNQ